MSSRQIRRLQQLVEASAEADGSCSDNDAMPATMQVKQKNAKKSKRSAQKVQDKSPPAYTSHADSDGDVPPVMCTSTPPPMKSVNTATVTMPLPTASAAAEAQGDISGGSHHGNNTDVEEEDARRTKRLEERKQRKRQLQKRKKALEEEEDQLLEQVLQERHREAPNRIAECTVDTSPEPEPGSSGDLVELLLRCDTTRLNTRLERIRMFGATAVEDVGDGLTPHRRVDGGVRDNNSNSIFPEHHMRLKFHSNVFVTPNRYRWPPFDALGAYLRVSDHTSDADDGDDDNGTAEEGVRQPSAAVPSLSKTTKLATSAPLEYVVVCDSSAFTRAEEARQLCIMQYGGVPDLLTALSNHGAYHVPTLLTLSQAFQLTGDALRSQEVVDVALYTVGTLLSHFPLSSTWCRRVLRCVGPSQWVHMTLHRGLHVALRRGCTRTAWETGRCLLSLDPRDPMGVLLLLDYLALRAKRWAWLLEVYQHIAAVADVPEADGAGDTSDSDALARRIAQLPGFWFSAALSKRFLEKELERAASSSPPSRPADGPHGPGASADQKQGKVLRDMTPAQLAALHNTPPATVMLAEAMQRHPIAAKDLVDALQGAATVCRHAPGGVDPQWALLEMSAAAAKARVEGGGGVAEEETLRHHLARLFVVRSADMWRPTEATQCVRDTITAATTAGDPGVLGRYLESHGGADLAGYDADDAPAATFSLLAHYAGLSDEVVVGTTTAIPEELLRADEEEEDGAVVGLGPVAMQHLRTRLDEAERDRPLLPLEEDLLLRLRALYGPAAHAGAGSPFQQLQAYRAQFVSEDVVRERLGGRNLLQLLLLTLAPWNDVQEMALREELQRRGIEDPVIERNRERRAEDERLWEEDEAEWFSAESDSELEFHDVD